MKIVNLSPDQESKSRYLYQLVEELVPLHSYIQFEASLDLEYLILIEIKSKNFYYRNEASSLDFDDLVLMVKEDFRTHLKQWYKDRNL